MGQGTSYSARGGFSVGDCRKRFRGDIVQEHPRRRRGNCREEARQLASRPLARGCVYMILYIHYVYCIVCVLYTEAGVYTAAAANAGIKAAAYRGGSSLGNCSIWYV